MSLASVASKQSSTVDFIQSEGLIFLPHILRRLANRFIQACDVVFPDFGIIVPPRAVSTMHLLHQRGPQSVTEIAEVIQQSHPLVITWVRQLKSMGLIATRADPKDRRRTMVGLTSKGEEQVQRLLVARPAFLAAYRRLMKEADVEIFDGLWRMEQALMERTFAERITAESFERSEE